MGRDNYSVRADRDIEESKRRELGEFYTPLIWVDEAYNTLERTLGTGWEKDYVVWDSSCGTGNLTRGRGIKKLYNSTLIAEDFEIGDLEGVVFQYDFLNDDVNKFQEVLELKKGGFGYNKHIVRQTKLYKEAPGLIKTLERGESTLFIINPPYRAANNLKTRVRGEEISIKGGNKTAIRGVMQKDRTNLGVGQLYAQFLYRINQIREIYQGEIHIALYSKQRVITANMMSGLRDVLKENFTVSETFSFRADHFSGCSGDWAVMFSMWVDNRKNFKEDTVTVLKDTKEGKVVRVGEQELYALEPRESLQEWIVEGIQGIETTKDAVYLSNGFKAYHKKPGNGRAVTDFLGGYFSKSNVVEKNSNYVVLTSELMGDGSSKNITKANFDRVISSFAARKLVTGKYANWKTDALEYMKPNTKHKDYSEWLNDCLVFSIFHNDSYQTSIRGMEYNGEKWDIKNEFFFMSKNEIEEEAKKYGLKSVIKDIERQGQERYIYKRIKEEEEQGNLSKEAMELLETCRVLLIESIPQREDASKELQLDNWDAGWMQVKRNLSKEQYDRYYAKLKDLEDKMRPMVWELGFLK